LEGEGAARAVLDLVGSSRVGSSRVEVLVDQPVWVGVLIRELCGTGLFVCQRDDCEIVLGIGSSTHSMFAFVSSAEPILSRPSEQFKGEERGDGSNRNSGTGTDKL
jgi:hypothetical protein